MLINDLADVFELHTYRVSKTVGPRVHRCSVRKRRSDRVVPPWEQLAVLPESFATAWTCLFRNLEPVKGRTLVIRGATSSFGIAALKLAVSAGAKVIATTRNPSRFQRRFEAKPSRVFKFEEIREAHRVMESNQANGKLVVVV